MSHDVFISHSSIDKSIADAVTAALEQAQIRCWIAPRDILPGESWGGSIVDAIESSKVMVIIFSSHSNDSKQVMREVERAVQKDVVVVPVRVENVQPSRDMEYFLSATHWLDAITPEMDVHLKDLTATVQALLNKSPSSSATAPPPAPPPPVAAEASARPRSKLTMLVPVLGLLAVVGAGLWFFGGSPEQSSEPDKASSTNADNVADNKPTDLPAEKKQSGDIRLKVADKVMAAAQMQVDWGGEAAARDAVMIANPDAQDSAYLQRVVIKNNKPINITAPDKPGVFEIRFLDAASRSVIARRDLIVELPELSLSSPDSIGAGKAISVDWRAPNNKGDYLSIALAGSDDKDYLTYAYTTKGSPTVVRAPDQAGDYELRYISSQTKFAWARRPLTVLENEVSLVAPETEVAGRESVIEWTGPANKGDYLSVAEPGSEGNKYVNYSYVKAGKAATLRMPESAGKYEIRYISGQAKLIWASSPVEITKPSVLISVPASAVAGSEVAVDWQGPANKRDYISVADAGSGSNQYHSYKYVKPGARLSARMPDAAGDYMVRYVSGQNKHIWAEAPIAASERRETLTNPASVAPNTKFTVSWTAKGNQGDYVAIYKPGADVKQYESYVYTRDKVNATLKAPTETGDYELRYISGQQKLVWATTAFSVK